MIAPSSALLLGLLVVLVISFLAVRRSVQLGIYKRFIFELVKVQAERDVQLINPTQASLLFQWRVELYNEWDRNFYCKPWLPLSKMWDDYKFLDPVDRLDWQSIVEDRYKYLMLYLREMNGQPNKGVDGDVQ
jgi:hypothetical protein